MKFTASPSDAKHVRSVLRELGAFYTERRHWVFWREFTVTGPDAILGAVSEMASDARIAGDYGVNVAMPPAAGARRSHAGHTLPPALDKL